LQDLLIKSLNLNAKFLIRGNIKLTQCVQNKFNDFFHTFIVCGVEYVPDISIPPIEINLKKSLRIYSLG